MRSAAHTRRTVRRSGWLVVVVSLLVGAVALPTARAALPAAAQNEVDKKGVLKQAFNLDQLQGLHFDPTKSPTIIDLAWMQLAVGTLLIEDAKGGYEGMLAKSVDVVDPQTIKLTLRDNITYTDGGKLTGDAVRASLLRTLNEAATEAVKAGQHTAFKYLADVIVDGPLAVTLKLNTPAAGEFIPALGNREGTIVSPVQLANAPQDIDTKPASAGPYVLTEFTPLQVMSLRKNDKYFDAKNWPLGGIDFVQTPVGPAGTQGLIGGAVDLLSGVPQIDAATLEANPKFEVGTSSTDFSYIYMTLCATQPPFDNADIRKALQIGIDRDALNDLVYQGQFAPAYGLWPEGNKNFNPKSKTLLKTNVKKAKKLVANSGVQNPTVDIYYPAPVDYARLGEALQAQLGELGIKVNVKPSRDVVTEFLQANIPGALLIPGSRTGVDKYGRIFSPGSQQVVCGKAHPEIMVPVNQTAALDPSDPKTAKLFQEAELMIAENAWVIPLIYSQTYTAWNKSRVGGEPQFSGARAALMYDTFYIKKGS